MKKKELVHDFNFTITSRGLFDRDLKRLYTNPKEHSTPEDLYNTLVHEPYHQCFEKFDLELTSTQEEEIIKWLDWSLAGWVFEK